MQSRPSHLYWFPVPYPRSCAKSWYRRLDHSKFCAVSGASVQLILASSTALRRVASRDTLGWVAGNCPARHLRTDSHSVEVPVHTWSGLGLVAKVDVEPPSVLIRTGPVGAAP